MQSFAIETLIAKNDGDELATGAKEAPEGDATAPLQLTLPRTTHRHCPYPLPDSRDDGIRRYRTAFTREQITRLEREFAKENYVSRKTRGELAAELGLPEGTIKVWFQNRRMKDKRQKMSGVPWSLMPPHIAYMLTAPFQCDFWKTPFYPPTCPPPSVQSKEPPKSQ